MNARTQALAVDLEVLRQRQAALAWLAAALLSIFAVSGCRAGAAAELSTATKPVEATISGTVRGLEGTRRLDGRVVEVVNVDSGERRRETTNHGGGFAFKVRPGKYRVELALLPGESILRQPDVIELHHRDAGTNADFVVGSSRVSRPRPAYRTDDGLGAPIA